MPHPNRVTPFGDFEATPARGLLTGNRGVLHDAAGRIGEARWRHPHWIACALSYKGWRRRILQPNRWTELFFLDEATAFAAGHRPCALCRRADYERFRQAWSLAEDGARPPAAAALDRALHDARLTAGRPRRQRRWRAHCAEQPDGVLLVRPERPQEAGLKRGQQLLRGSHFGYEAPAPLPEGPVAVLTPRPTVAAFAAGYRPALHRSSASA